MNYKCFLAREVWSLVKLSLPIILSQVFQMSLYVADVIMVGHYHEHDLAAIALGSSIFFPVFLFFLGIISSLNPIVGKYLGERKKDRASIALRSGLILSLFIAVGGFFVVRLLRMLLFFMDIDTVLAQTANDYIGSVSWGFLFISPYLVFRFFFEGNSHTIPAMVISFSSIPLNIIINYLFIYDYFGIGIVGAEGCGYATSLVNLWAFLCFVIYFFISHSYRPYRVYLESNWQELKEEISKILKIGFPIGISIGMEVSMFAVSTLMVGVFGSSYTASHQIAINIVSLLFMIPFGLSTAITARVSHAFGQKKITLIRIRSYIGLGLAVMVAVLSSVILFFFDRFIISAYTFDERIIELAVPLIYIAVFFQLSDSLQACGFGILKGLHDTRYAMIAFCISYWLVGIPLSYLFSFEFGFGFRGVWIGLSVGLTVAALLLNGRFVYLNKKILHLIAN